MCFSKKMKVPKPNMEQKAPDPILLEPPKGVDFGDGPDDATDGESSVKGRDSVTIKPTQGDGTPGGATAKDTGAVKKTTASSAIKRAAKR